MKYLFASAMASTAAAVAPNSTPIYGTYPGWVEGKGQGQIQIELFYDFMCSDCLAENPVVEEFMNTKFQDGVVSDYIYLAMSPFPLPYHVHAWQVGWLVPYFMDLCAADSSTCYMDQYKDFSFKMQPTVLSMTDTSLDDFIPWWSKQVADELGLNEADIEAVYGPNDTHDTAWKIREIWKYATGKGVNGTPFAFINGVKLDSVPTTVSDWVDLLNSIYSSQWT